MSRRWWDQKVIDSETAKVREAETDSESTEESDAEIEAELEEEEA